MTFTRLLPSIVALAAALTLFFAGGAAPAQADPQANPFAGNWSGTWIGVENGQDGTLDFTISDAGLLTGRVYHTQDGQGGEVRGHVRADGDFKMVGFAPSDDPSHGGGVPLQGTAMIDDDGRLNASLTWVGLGLSFNLILERN
jgi:hypothetical protein